MAKKSYPKGKSLINLFIDAIGNYDGFRLIKRDTVCKFEFDGETYYAYFKCVSPEGNPYPIENQRAQLPERPEFVEVLNSKFPFLFLGYDIDNDVFVCWEPHKVKPRLNRKSYVSFYSRLSAQESVIEGKIKEEILSNGDKFVLFKRTDIIPFLQMIDIHFPELIKTPCTSKISEKDVVDSKGKDLQGRIMDVREDEAVKLLIDSFPEETPSLTIVSECMNQFGQFYDKMQFSDWGKLIRKYLKNKFDC